MHTGREGFSALPFYDNFDLSQVDILLISQYVETFPFLQHSNYSTLEIGRKKEDKYNLINTSLLDLEIHSLRQKCTTSTGPILVSRLYHQYNFVHHLLPCPAIFAPCI